MWLVQCGKLEGMGRPVLVLLLVLLLQQSSESWGAKGWKEWLVRHGGRKGWRMHLLVLLQLLLRWPCVNMAERD